MAITFGDFKEILLRNLKSEEGATYPNGLLWDACVGALNAVLPWSPNAAVTTLTAGTPVSNRLALPSDFYQVDGVFDPDAGYLLERFILSPNSGRILASTPLSSNDRVDWMIYPQGYLYLSRTPASGKTFDLFYRAYWPVPADEDDDTYEFSTPDSLRNGLLYYAMAHCMLPSSASSAQIRQFNTRIDSGTPVDNVLEQAARYFRLLFVEEMNKQPKYTGGTNV